MSFYRNLKSTTGNINNLVVSLLILSLSICAGTQAKIANPYPVAVLRQGDIYLLKGNNDWQQLTFTGDVAEICWLDPETICCSREMDSGLSDQDAWHGLTSFRDLFTISKNGGAIKQFTVHHFASEPAPGTIDGRAFFTHRLSFGNYETEIWETIRPLIRARSLGIRGRLPDGSPDHKWTAAALTDTIGGVGLYRYPTNDAYRKLTGSFTRPRFSPNGAVLSYLNYESGEAEIWAYEIPDGEPKKICGAPEEGTAIMDFGWTEDGSGFILVLRRPDLKRDLYYYNIVEKRLQRLSEFGDIIQATSWH
ncbi:MAG: hypothetical protein ABH878_03800 [bacterium]